MTTLPPGHCLLHHDHVDTSAMIADFRKDKTPESRGSAKKTGAGNETRTRDPDLGKVVLYQLSYSRIRAVNYSRPESLVNSSADLNDAFPAGPACTAKSPAETTKPRTDQGFVCNLERETRLELATPTLARSCSTN